MASTLKPAVKTMVGQPEDNVPVISTASYVKDHLHSPKQAIFDYLCSLFPIFGWITRYNVGWFTGDLIAGLTVGIVAVPLGISYAQLATLPPQYGLYSSFVGALVYCSSLVPCHIKGVLSLVTSQMIAEIDHKFPGKWQAPEIATTAAFVSGFIVLAIGIFRIGWVVEFIPAPAVTGFITGSAISIVVGQIPGLMGISGFNASMSTFEVIINTLKGLPRTRLDAAWGLSGLIALHAIRIACSELQRRFPRSEAHSGCFSTSDIFFVMVARNAVVILVLTIAAWLYCRHHKTASGYPIKILETAVPSGFQHVGPVAINMKLVKALASQLPAVTIVLLLEQIAIAKSFGRVNNYKIKPDQELIALGVINTIGSIFHTFPVTGTFSRSALQSKSGVRTPASGLVAAIVVVVALYGLTPAFYWVPNAGLSAVIIHAVADIVTPPAQVYAFWLVSPLEFFIWLAAVLVTVFSTIEDGIYTSVIASLVLLLFRLAHPRGYFLGKVTLTNPQDNRESRDVFLPLRPDGVNPGVKVVPPAPGIIIYRFEESFLYPNCSIVNSVIVDHVKENMRRGIDVGAIKLQDRAWNDVGPIAGGDEAAREVNDAKPKLRAIIFDFSAVSHIDTTAIQSLNDTRNEVERWTNGPVQFHFASVLSPWVQRALIGGRFGIGTLSDKPNEVAFVVTCPEDVEASETFARSFPGTNEGALLDTTMLPSPTMPFFHIDLVAALWAVEVGSERRISPHNPLSVKWPLGVLQE